MLVDAGEDDEQNADAQMQREQGNVERSCNASQSSFFG